jgi:hypothetical protein
VLYKHHILEGFAMKKNNLRFLGFLGLIGLLGFPTGNYGFFGFFGAFAFFAYGDIKNDEMLMKNIAKAGLNAFIVSFVGIAFAIAALSTLKTLEVAALFIGGIFFAQLITFIISYNVYEKRGDI